MTLPRVYPILDAATLAASGVTLLDAAAALMDGGARILQLRSKQHWSPEHFEAAEAIAALCARSSVTFIVNDRADMAALLDAGLHVGQDDLSPADARRVLGPFRALGFSTHNPEQLRQASAEPVSYVAFGPVFPTMSKTQPDPVVGLATLKQARVATPLPLVAIGGITRENARTVLETGVDSVAIIAGMYPCPCTAHLIRERMEQWLLLTQN